MELHLLGPVEIRHHERPVAVGRRLHRLLLGILALRANTLVSTSELVDLLWSARAPRTARAMVHSRVSELRTALTAAGIGDEQLAILTDGGGYRMLLDPTTVDVHRFRLLVARGCTADGTLDWPQRRDLLREAVALWRGPAFGGWLPRQPPPPEVESLEDARLTALEQLFEAELNTDADAGVLVERLGPLATQHPSRERFTLSLMRALAASHRPGDALRAYEQHRRWLAAELGADPSDELRQLHLTLLRAVEPDGSPPGTATSTPTLSPGPAELPAEPGGFVGRRAELTHLDAAVRTGSRIVALVGPAGVGKTALALRFAHARLHQRPVAHLYADLRGAAEPVAPATVLERFLRALGVPGDAIPADLDERAARYRSELAGQPALILLDNAASSHQVRPLLPGAGSNLVLITSRRRLDGLVATHGATQVVLAPLTESDAQHLLRQGLTASAADKSADESADLRRIAELCDRLPLALRIAAARLGEFGDGTALAGRLAAEGDRIGLLTAEDVSVRAALQVSLTALDAPSRTMFHLLGVHPGQRPGTEACAALAGLPPAVTRDLLDRLAAVHLVRSVDGRHQMHDLVRLFAAELAAADPAAASAALRRTLTFYRDTAAAADRVLRPAERPNFDTAGSPVRFADVPAALAWLDAEADNLVAAVERAEADHPRLAWQIAAAMYGWLFRRHQRDRWIDLYSRAVRAARQVGDARGEAMLSGRLAIPLSLLGRHDEAAGHGTRAYELRVAGGDQLGAATALLNLAAIENNAGRPAEAIRRLTQAEERSRTLPDAGHLRALVASNLGEAHQLAGRLGDAVAHYRTALALAETHCGARDTAEILVGLARTHRRAGQPLETLRLGQRAVEQARLAGDVLIEAEAREELGQAHLARRDHARALAELSTALETYRAKGHRGTAELTSQLAELTRSTPE
ncbi:BTAD domain-containing putative transcriptional regulator [Verrucosispora sp. WMMA2121]|uniref:AfsR/SARP family transcriptional regulator n=1 Tax=Verrucosispora sp. WMMA2121 TaxID=3015164 RepID=UPI0022B68BAA|nr:BTAD domain-containing putative transcriptional regulator [Verrucosispora sp. WMMA2121]MCZ7424017.1 BTAD domain-containing putative transcriptional regulator [Verrucosispora sp. WMMA2121]